MRLEINLSLAEAWILQTAAMNLSLPLVVVYTSEPRVSSIEFPDAALVPWLRAKDAMMAELLMMGMHWKPRRSLVTRLWITLSLVQKKETSAIKTVLGRKE